jgi:hypothetical protein
MAQNYASRAAACMMQRSLTGIAQGQMALTPNAEIA